MSDKVSDERLREYAASFNNPDVRALAAELLTLRAQQQAAGWRVKPLEWVDVGGGDWHAQSILGLYQIWRSAAGRYKVASATSGQSWGTLDEAKAAAQSDYAARINSAIEPAAVALPTEVQVMAAAEAMWRAETADMPAAHRARTSQVWREQSASTLNKWLALARAALLAARPISASGRDGE